MSSTIFYGGTQIDKVDFNIEYDKELQNLKQKIAEIEAKKAAKGDKFNSQIWTLKLARANKALDSPKVTLD